MAACQCIIVVEDGTLEFDILYQERYVLDLLDLLDQARAISWNGRDLVHVPDIAGLLDVLISVDLGLFVSPIGKRGGVRPHGDSRRGVDQFEVSGETLELLLSLGIFDLDLEQRIVIPLSICLLDPYGCKLLVCGVIWGGNIVR